MHRTNAFGLIIFVAISLSLSSYFAYSAVRGDLGVIERLEAEAELRRLTHERDRLEAEVDQLANLTLRLSDNYLDLDLLDERARNILGWIRADELIIR